MKKVTLLLLILLILFIILVFPIFTKRAAEYNKYMCANYGYKADCKTPLPESERLK